MAYISTWSLTVVFGYAPLGSGRMSYCTDPFSSPQGWGLDTRLSSDLVPRPNSTHAILRITGRAQRG